MSTNLQFSADLVTFTEEKKVHYLCSASLIFAVVALLQRIEPFLNFCNLQVKFTPK